MIQPRPIPIGSITKRLFLIMALLPVLLFFTLPSLANPSEDIIRVGVLRNWPPQYVWNQETGKPGGFAIDIVDLVAEKSKLEIEYKVYDTWPDLNEAGESGEIDMIANMGFSESRLSDYLFSNPYDTFKVQLFVRSSSTNIAGLNDLNDRKVGVVARNIGVELVDRLQVGIVRSFDHVELAFLALLAGTVDAVIYPDVVFNKIAAQSGLQSRIKTVGEPLIEVKRSIAVVKGKTDLYVKVNRTLKKILNSNDYQEIYGKWYQTPEPFWNSRRVGIVMGLVLGITVIGLLLWRFFSLWKLNKVLEKTIEEKQHTQDALRESESNFRQLAETIHEVFWIVSADWKKVEYISPAYEEIWGLSCQSLYDNPISCMDAVLEEDRTEINKLINQRKNEDYTIVVFPEFRVRRPDGEIRWILARGFPVRDEKENIYRVVGIAEDITRQKEAAEALQVREEQVRLLLEHTGEAIYGVDLNGHCTFANPSCVRILGYESARDLVGADIHDLIHSRHENLSEYPEAECRILQAIEEGKSVHEDSEVFWKSDGTSIPVEYRSAPILRKGEIVGAVVNFVDITQRREAERALQSAKVQLESKVEKQSAEVTILSRAVEQSPNTVVITDAEGVIEYVNPKFTVIYGYSLEEAIGEKTSILKADNVTREDFENLWKTIKDGREWRGELHNLKKDGSRVWQLVSISPVKNRNGDITHFIASQENIDAAKQLEFELQNAMVAAEKANHAKSAFLANMSHELRTPLNAIIGFTQLLERRSYGDLNDKQKRFFNRIKEAGDHLLQMVNDILDLSKVEAGKFEIEKRPFDFGLMLSRSPLTIQSLANKKNIRVETKIPDNLGWLEGDEVRIKQVIFNLLSNAFKFTESGKSIGIEAAAEYDTIVVTVWDQGRGISREDQQRVFEPFEQILNGQGGAEGGTGLGLAISKKLVELHGGSIHLSSEPGEGSRFVVIFPGRVPEEQRVEKDAPGIADQSEKMSRTSLKILVAEDNENNRHLIEAALTIRGYQLQFAHTGEEAVEKAARESFDVILMDIRLPGISGSEAMKRIKRNYSKPIPVIAVTAFAMKGDRQKYLDEGFDAYVSKPIAIDDLQEAIDICLNP